MPDDSGSDGGSRPEEPEGFDIDRDDISDTDEAARAWRREAFELFEQGHYGDALQLFDRVLKLCPQDADCWVGRGDALRKLGRPREALRAYDKARKIAPRSADAWIGKGHAFKHLRRYDDAREAFEKALELGCSDASEALEDMHSEGH